MKRRAKARFGAVVVHPVVDQLRRLESLLAAGPATKAELAAAMGCSAKTIQRALRTLQRGGAVLEQIVEAGNEPHRWRLRAGMFAYNERKAGDGTRKRRDTKAAADSRAKTG
jgi:predicted ArsR family transcriptional regulator